MENIKINITLPKESELKANLNNLLNGVSKSTNLTLDLNIDSFRTSINEVNQAISKLKNQMSNLGGLENVLSASGLKNSNDELERQNNLLKEQQKLRDSNVLKTSYTYTPSGDGEDIILRDLEQIRDEYGRIVQIVNTYSKNTGEIINTNITVTDEVEKQRLAYEKLEKSVSKVKDTLQNKLNKSLDNKDFTGVDENVLNGFQQRINSINTDTPVEEIRQLQRELVNLGNSDSQIVRLQNAINKYELTLKSLEGKHRNLLPEEELNTARVNVERLKSSLEELQSGRNFTSNRITNMLNDTSTSVRQLSNNVRETGDSFMDIARKVGVFSLVYDGINKLQDVFRDGVQSVIDMDTALADLNKVVPLSNSQLEMMRDTAVEMGEALGRSAVNIAQAQAEFGRMTKDTNAINDMVRSATIGANTMGVGADEVAKGLTTIMSSLKIEASESIDIINSLNEVQNNYTITSKDLLDGLAEVGSVAETAGLSLDQLNGYMTAIQQSTGKTGDSIGTSLNSILSRLYRTGRGGMEASGQSENALASVGVALRDANGEFRKAGDVLDDLNKVWGTLTETQQIYTAQQIAGTTQFNELVSLMQNYDTAVQATETSINSLGSAEKENEIYLQSIQGRMESLTASMQGFFLNFIDSDLIKGGVSALQGLVDILNSVQNTFGSLGPTVGTLSAIFLTFANNPLKQMRVAMNEGEVTAGKLSTALSNIKASVTTATQGMSGMSKVTTGLKAGFTAIGTSAMFAQAKVILLETALTMGLSLAITGIISGLTKLVDWLITTDEEAKELNENLTQSVTQTAKSVTEAENLLLQKKNLDSQISNSGDTEKRVELEKELLEVEKQLASVLPSSASGFDEQGNAISGNNALIEEQIRLKKEQMEMEALQFLQANKNVAKEMKDYQERLKLIEDYKLAMMQGKDYEEEFTYKDAQGNTKTGVKRTEVTPEKIAKLNEENVEAMEIISQMGIHLDTLYEAGYSRSKLESLGVDIESFEKQTKAIEETTKELEKNTQAKEENAKAISVGSATPGVSAETVQGYSKAISELDKVQTLINSINEEQGITPTILSQLAEQYPQLGASISDVTEVQKFLNEEVERQTEIANQSYEAMIQADNNFYKNKFLQNEEWTNQFRQSLIDMGMSSEDAYNLDLSQFENLQELKAYAMDELGDGVANWLSQYIDISANGYNIDFKNFRDANQAKLAVLDALNQEIKKVSGNIVEQSLNVARFEGMSGLSNNPLLKKIDDSYAKEQKRLAELKTAVQEVNTVLPDFSLGLSGFGGSIGTGGISGIGGSGGSSSSGKSATEKEVEDKGINVLVKLILIDLEA